MKSNIACRLSPDMGPPRSCSLSFWGGSSSHSLLLMHAFSMTCGGLWRDRTLGPRQRGSFVTGSQQQQTIINVSVSCNRRAQQKVGPKHVAGPDMSDSGRDDRKEDIPCDRPRAGQVQAALYAPSRQKMRRPTEQACSNRATKGSGARKCLRTAAVKSYSKESKKPARSCCTPPLQSRDNSC